MAFTRDFDITMYPEPPIIFYIHITALLTSSSFTPKQPFPNTLSITHQIPPKHRSLTPIHRQQHPRPETDTLRKIHAPPQIHRQQPATEAQPVKIKHGRITNVRQTAQMVVLKRFIHRVVQVAVIDLIGCHPGRSLCELAEFPAKVLALLMGSLRRGR